MLTLQVHLKLQKILVSFSERLKQGFIKGRTVYKSFRCGDVYYSEELMVCVLVKTGFLNDNIKGYCVLSRCWRKKWEKSSKRQEVMQKNGSSSL